MNMNRRNLLKALVVLPVAGTIAAHATEWPNIVGVKETPWLSRKVRVFCNSIEQNRAIRCSVQEGWCEVFAVNSQGCIILSADGMEARKAIIRGDVRIEWKDA